MHARRQLAAFEARSSVAPVLPVQFTNQIIVHGMAGSGCLTALQAAWTMHGYLPLRMGVAVY